MMSYTEYDYLCNELFHIEGIGFVKCPTLRDIRKITYNTFLIYLNILVSSMDDYQKMFTTVHENDEMSSVETSSLSKYELLLLTDIKLFSNYLEFFIYDQVKFEANTLEFSVVRDDEIIGTVNNDNFNEFTNTIKRILGLEKNEEQSLKFKNEYAKKMYEMFELQKKKQKSKFDEDYSLDNMIRKYCTHNKVGINILNVWDMTYYQFIAMFNEYSIGRQCDFNDAMAANTFSYKKASDYKPMDYVKKIK